MIDVATFAGGCFWCTEAVFKRLIGVIEVTPGYCGGSVENPTYAQVSRGDTGHAESIQIKFDNSQITYNVLLDVFFATHDPTTLNKQGNDVGAEYRSVVFYNSEAQQKAAESKIKELDESKTYINKIVTKLEPLDNFYIAENYHKNYYDKNPNQAYCTFVINPKLDKLLKNFKNIVQPEFL